MKLLTVTVPCYNSQDYMEKCVRSLLKGGQRVQIVIINDGSKDKTGEIAERLRAENPGIITVVHQENGGHGEGINSGLAHAEGKYFKVVDSDDWVSDDFCTFLDRLEKTDADLVVTNYYYEHSDGKGNRAINYSNALPAGREFEWSETKAFKFYQILTIHSCTFRTELMRRHMGSLPKHIFYEDNLMVFRAMPYVRKTLYLNTDLYRYFIGREGQSVQRDVMTRRYTHQLEVAKLCFTSCRLGDITDIRLKKYLKHELFMMFAIAVVYARLNKSDEADGKLEEMWRECEKFDKKHADYFRDKTVLRFACIRGKLGRNISERAYVLANKLVRFN